MKQEKNIDGGPYLSTQVARRMLDHARRDLIEVSAMRLQKLVYLAHEYNVWKTTKPLVSDPVEAWTNGPVFPELYRHIGNSDREIVESIPEKTHVDQLLGNLDQDQEAVEHIDKVYGTFRNFSGAQLSRALHRKGRPWHRARNGLAPGDFLRRLLDGTPKRPEISLEIIKRHFWNAGLWRRAGHD